MSLEEEVEIARNEKRRCGMTKYEVWYSLRGDRKRFKYSSEGSPEEAQKAIDEMWRKYNLQASSGWIEVVKEAEGVRYFQ